MISCRRYDDDQCLMEFHTEFTLERTLEEWTKNIGLCWNERNNNSNTLYSLNYILKILSKFIFTEIRASLLIEYIYRF